MKTMKKMTAVGAVLAGTLLVASQAQATVAYQFPANLPSNVQSQSPYLYGNSFTVLQPNLRVSAVGAYDASLDGFGPGVVPVALYVSDGAPTPTWAIVPNTLASFTGNSGWDWTEGSARMKNLQTEVPLTAGLTYAIVAAYEGVYLEANGTDTRAWDYDVTHVPSPTPGFDNQGGAIAQAGGPLSPRSSFFIFPPVTTLPSLMSAGIVYSGGHDVADYAGATLAIVPEASHFAFAGIGLLGLVYVGRSTPVRRWLKLA